MDYKLKMSDVINAKHYNKNSQFQKSVASNVLSYHTFSSDEKILDIGCGDGEITKLLSTNCKTTGIDLCSNMINFAKKYNSSVNTYYLNTAILDFNDTEKYSLITAFNSIYWCGDLEKVFSKIYNLLYNSGKFLIVTYPKESPYWLPIVTLLESNKWNKWKDISITKYWLTTDEYIKSINNSNLNLIQCHTCIEEISYKNSNEYLDYINGWLPLMFNKKFPIKEFMSDLVNSIWTENNYLNIKYKKVVLYGEK